MRKEVGQQHLPLIHAAQKASSVPGPDHLFPVFKRFPSWHFFEEQPQNGLPLVDAFGQFVNALFGDN